jgi:hypothetical protein
MVMCVCMGLRSDRVKRSIPQGASKLYIGTVVNNIKLGPLTGNKNLALGVKNVLAEAAQDRGWILVQDAIDAEVVVNVELLYFDTEQTKSNVSVFHKDEDAVIIKMRGTTYDGEGKVIKSLVVDDKSTEISTSTFLINEGGTFNSQVAKQAVKKTCVLLAYRLL